MQLLSSKKIVLLTGLGISLISAGRAQDTAINKPAQLFSGTSSYRTWSIGVHGGMLFPSIAIGGRNDFSKGQGTIGYGAYIKNQISHRFGIQADFLRGTLEGNNDNGAPAGTPYKSFKTDINWSAALSGVITLGNINWTQLHTAVQPYVSVGGGVLNYNPVVTNNAGTAIDFKPDGSISKFFIPVGIGLKFNLSQSMNLDMGYRMNFVDGDDLDGFYNPPYLSDKFSYGHLGLEFALGGRNKPQLATHNPAAQLKQDLVDQNNALRASLNHTEAKVSQLQQDLAAAGGWKAELDKMKMDSDKDGVADFFDKCPNTPAGEKVDGSGCPLPVAKDTTIIRKEQYVITEEDRRIVSDAIKNLEFDFGKSTIRSTSYPTLNRVAEILVKKGFSLKLAGHTDNVGSDAANMKLSKDRAESVKSYLVSQGANPSRIEAVGYGESQPIESNKTAAGRQKNRRVEFTLY